MIPLSCDGCGAEPLAVYHAIDAAWGHIAWNLCGPCLECVEADRIDPADGEVRGAVYSSLQALRVKAWTDMEREACELAGRCAGHELWNVIRARIAAPCEVCFGTIEPTDRYWQLLAGGGGSRRSWRVCANCRNAPAELPLVSLPRETWRARELAESIAATEAWAEEWAPHVASTDPAESLDEIPF